jgi:hypothetical protein
MSDSESHFNESESRIDIVKSVFKPDKFHVFEKDNDYEITTTDRLKMCLHFTIVDKINTIKIHGLKKCNSSGKELLQLLKELAEKLPDIHYIWLVDDSQILTECKNNLGYDTYKSKLEIDLALLRIITNPDAMSWYNSLGYISPNFAEEQRHNDYVLQLPFNVLMDHNSHIITVAETNRKIRETANRLFPDISMQLPTQVYVNKIYDSIGRKFDNFDEESCEKYTFISNLLSAINPNLIYKRVLKKTISHSTTAGGNKKKKISKNGKKMATIKRKKQSKKKKKQSKRKTKCKNT